MATVEPRFIGVQPYTLMEVPRGWIKPYFGYAKPNDRVIIIDETLPKSVYDSVLAHEEYHLFDKEFDSYKAREKRAWKFQWTMSKRKTLCAILYSVIKWYRIKLYWDLFRNKPVQKPRTVRADP